jgi:GUN4-like
MLTTETNEVKLASAAVDIDYSELRNLLASKKWQDADRETARLMLRVTKREEKGWLDRKSIQEFPCKDLQIIDQLWVKYSNDRFGFSVQQRIYQNVRARSEDDSEVWQTFRDMVGWLKKGEKFHYSHLNFSEKAPEAHLPAISLFAGLVGIEIESGSFEQQHGVLASLGGVVFKAIALRLLTCNI